MTTTDSIEKLLSDINACYAQGDINGAAALCAQVLSINPYHTDTLYLLSLLEKMQGQFDSAIAHLTTLISIDEYFISAYIDLSVLLHAQQQSDLAIYALEKALAIEPNNTTVLLACIDLLSKTNRLHAALTCCETILKNEPQHAEALQQKAFVLQKMERLTEAVIAYDAALAVKPKSLFCLNNKGSILLSSLLYTDALNCFLKALVFYPKNVVLHTNISHCLSALDQFDDAMIHYQQALLLDPTHLQALMGYANFLSKHGRFADALQQYSRVLSLDASITEARWAYTLLSIVVDYTQQTPNERIERKALSKLRALKSWCDKHPSDATTLVGFYQFFVLTYQAHNHKRLLQAHGDLCCKMMQGWFDRQQFVRKNTAHKTRKKIGIITADIGNHSVWLAITHGLLTQLAAADADVNVYYLNQLPSKQAEQAAHHATRFESGVRPLSHWVQCILDDDNDVLIYPAIGMDMITLQLACLRLAKIQIASWGHPETTGLPTIDYYLSAQMLEPDDAAQHYSETLLTLPQLGSHYPYAQLPDVTVDLAALHIDTRQPVLVCAGIALKYDRTFDHVFVEIAQRLPTATFVFFKSTPLYCAEQLEQRLRKAFEKAGLNAQQQLRFIPWQSATTFFSVLKQATLLLDTIGFSGFNTAMQALQCELPIVTIAGEFMRGRFASGILRCCDLEDLIAENTDQYVKLAVKLATDKAYQQRTRKKIKAAHPLIFDNAKSLTGLFALIADIVDENSQGEPI